ncbi:hypothetical protein GCM10017750_36280 [Streptomyces racemochromogenes]
MSSSDGTRGDGTLTLRDMTGATPATADGLRDAPAPMRSVNIGRAESHIRDTSVFARSGGNHAYRHGVSVLTGKTFLVDRGDTLI